MGYKITIEDTTFKVKCEKTVPENNKTRKIINKFLIKLIYLGE